MTSTESPLQSFVIPAWLLDLVRGAISIGLGMGLLLWRSQTLTVVVWILVLNILGDGVFDILAFFRGRRRQDIGRAHLIIGILSCLAAGLLVLQPSVAFTIFLYYIAVRAGLHGLVDLWALVTSFRQREASLLLLVRGALWILVSAALIVAPRIAVNVVLNLFAVFFFLDGLGSFASAAVKSGRLRPRGRAEARGMDETRGADEASALANPQRAVVFVRRSGANGLGHVGWAFEWRTGWFNTGSVENESGAAFAPPDKMDFWTTHTLHPVATMREVPISYDEFKVFHVAEPYPKEAWKTVVWVSRQSYSVVRRNCSDCAFDVLRSYGVTPLVDPAAENVPNNWYDSLPGQSYPILDGAEIPLDPARAEELSHLPVQEIELRIPPRIKASPPPWCRSGGRAWYEAQQRMFRVTSRARVYAAGAVTRVRKGRAFHKAPGDHRTPRSSQA